jgi:hypothetical protein
MAHAEVIKYGTIGASKAQRIATLDEAGDAAFERPKLLQLPSHRCKMIMRHVANLQTGTFTVVQQGNQGPLLVLASV